MNPSYRSRSTSLFVVLLFAGVLILSGCGRTIITSPFSPATPSTSTENAMALQADAAWKAGNISEATRLYTMLANNSMAPVSERSVACERLARMALSRGNNTEALAALNQWKMIAPGVESSSVWLELQQKTGITGTGSSSMTYASSCVTFVLPTTGDYSPFGNKIIRGAQIAQTELQRAGAQIDLRIINSESPSWLQELQQLPPQCVSVGGPLRHDRYVQMKNAGVTSSRAVFAFTPSLDGADEGAVAWRFFSSPEDQIQAVLGFTASLGINSYGLLSPSDAYGQRMGNMFTSAVRSKGGTVKVASYDPHASATWNDVMKSFIGSYMRGKVPVPSTTFQAAFIPDSWENLELIVPFLFYQGEDRLVLMGTNLWEQGLANKSSVNVANLDLAIFPGAWNASSPNASAAALISALAADNDVPEFWEGTGYDFIKFASLLNLQKPSSPLEINRRISTAQRMEWAMAPISWTNGKASQKLFIFHPTNTGFELVNPAEFKARLDEIRARHARRVGKK